MNNVGKCGVCGAVSSGNARFCSACGGRFRQEIDHYDGFISYRREGGSHIAALLKLLLETEFNKRFFLDVDELQVGRFDETLLKIIGDSPNFVLVLSSRSLDRCVDKNDWLKREIMHALENKRNIIPVLVDNFTFPDHEVMGLLPEIMRALPNFQAVAYNHLHRESAVRRIAEYCVESINFSEEAVRSRGPSAASVDWLLISRPEIEKANMDAFSDTEIALEQQSGSALPFVLWCITEQWNRKNLIVDKNDLKKQVATAVGSQFQESSWNTLYRCLSVRSRANRWTRTLLLTSKADSFAISYPGLAALWNSELGKAIKTTLHLEFQLRTPDPGAELEWVEWVRSLESRLETQRLGRGEAAVNLTTVDDVYPQSDRVQVSTSMSTLEKLPPDLRPAVSQHLGKVIVQKRSALISIRDQPGNSDAYAYIGLLFYWDLLRIAMSGSDEERQIARNAIWTDASRQYQGYLPIALYFLRRYLELAPNGGVKNDVTSAIAAMENIRISAQQFAKEQAQ